MHATIIDGSQIAKLEKQSLLKQITKFSQENNHTPGLAVILVGDDPASSVYVTKKTQACEQLGITSKLIKLPQDVSQKDLLNQIHKLNNDEKIDGILVQLPLPNHINSNDILEAINPNKDVDGFHPINMGKLALRDPALVPCTPLGIIKILEHINYPVKGCNAVIVGASNIVGRPLGLLLLHLGATITICHRFTKNLADKISQADLLIVAIGKPEFIQGEWIKPGAVVIDVGINRLASGKLIGDIQFATASTRAGFITPVPGGVGPMTVVSLMRNTLTAARINRKTRN